MRLILSKFLNAKPHFVRHFLDNLTDAMAPLWVSGLAILLAFLVYRCFGLQGKAFEVTVYMVLGTIYPALVTALALLSRVPRFTPLYSSLEVLLGIWCVLASAFFVIGLYGYHVLMALIAPGLMLIAFTYFSGTSANKNGSAPVPLADPEDFVGASDPVAPIKGQIFKKKARELVVAPVDRPRHSPQKTLGAHDGTQFTALVGLFVAAISWMLSVQILGGASFQTWIESSYTPLMLTLSMLLALVNLCHKGALPRDARATLRSIRPMANIAAVVVFAMLSFRTDRLFGPDEGPLMAYHHWSWFVGAAELVREGGWLLWDIPSPYGFLLTLLIALFPAKSVWQSFYIINASLIFLGACFLFFLLRSLRTGPMNYLFSLTVTIAAVFFIPYPPFGGSRIFPSTGAIRFFWCYVLLALLVWELRLTREEKPNRGVLWIGCVSWVIGVFWSAESAIYCTAMWLPAYTLIVLRNAMSLYKGPGDLKRRIGFIALRLMQPISVLLLAVAALVGYYGMFLGHAPDWRAFFEYGLAFTSNNPIEFPLDKKGPVWCHFIVFCAVSTAVLHLIRKGLGQTWALASATWAFLWASSGYTIVRGDGLNFACYMPPILCTVIALILYLFKQHGITDRWAVLIRMSILPFLGVLLTTAFGDVDGIRTMARAMQTFNRNIERQLPVMDKHLSGLLDAAQVKRSDPIVFLNKNLDMLPIRPVQDGPDGHRISFTRAWLPLKPFSGQMPPLLPEDRIKVYVSRFITRTHMSGYLIIQAGMLEKGSWYIAPPVWLLEHLTLTHTPTLVEDNGVYQLIWYEFKDHPH